MKNTRIRRSQTVRTLAIFSISVLSSLLGIGFAQIQISPQAIIVNPVNNALTPRVSVDRVGTNPAYRIGDAIRVNVSVNQDAYVYVFSVHSDGKIDLILPNKLSNGNEFLRAGETRSFPPRGANYQLSVDGPAGQDKVLVVVSKRVLNLNEIANFQGANSFANVTVQGQDNLARALSIVVQPVPASDWETAIAYFQVQNNASVVTPPIGSNQPSRAFIFKPLELMAFPGSVVQYQNADDDNATVEFTTNTSLDGVASYYRSAVVARGYKVVQYRTKRSRVTIQFQNADQDVNLEIKVKGTGFVLVIQYAK